VVEHPSAIRARTSSLKVSIPPNETIVVQLLLNEPPFPSSSVVLAVVLLAAGLAPELSTVALVPLMELV